MHNLYYIGECYERTTAGTHSYGVHSIDQLLKLEGIIETGGQIKSFIDEGILTLNGQVVTEKRKKCRVGDVISCEGLDVDLVITQEEA